MSANQTPTTSPIGSNNGLDFTIKIEENSLNLPNGLQSFAVGIRDDEWLLLCGRSNGLHGFSNTDENFPVSNQNLTLYVVNIKKGKIWTRSLTDPLSGLEPNQIDYLSVTNAQYSQQHETLYISGGYGINSQTEKFSTKPILSIIDLKRLIRWVKNPDSDRVAANYIKQIKDEFFQITGGAMDIIDNNFLLVFGQTFQGSYSFNDPPTFTQVYSHQVRRFHLHDDKVSKKSVDPVVIDPNYRRRDLSVMPRISTNSKGKLEQSLVAYSGVFTPNDGIWTVPVEISSKGKTMMADPNLVQTFKQGMNNYACASVAMYSKKKQELYTIFFGGITYGYFDNGVFTTDPEAPFTNQCTTVKINAQGQYSQYLMDDQYPTILSTTSNPGNVLLFGAEAEFILHDEIKTIKGGKVIDYDRLKDGMNLIGYIVGGIASTLPNTTTTSDTFASKRIFNVNIKV
jgi:hypothetical protein